MPTLSDLAPRRHPPIPRRGTRPVLRCRQAARLESTLPCSVDEDEPKCAPSPDCDRHHGRVSSTPHLPVLSHLSLVREYLYSPADVPRRWLVGVAMYFAEGVLLVEVDPAQDEVALNVGMNAMLANWADDVEARDVTATAR